MPGYLPKPEERVQAEERKWHDDRLLQMAAPYILRRSKIAVAPELPAKIEQIVYCDFEDNQKKFYEEILESTRQEIFEMEMSPAIAANPYVSFFAVASDSGTVGLRWTGDEGFVVEERVVITVE